MKIEKTQEEKKIRFAGQDYMIDKGGELVLIEEEKKEIEGEVEMSEAEIVKSSE